MVKIIGHRGARGLAPENTVASVQAALACGVDGIEFDMRVTADSIVVCVHDATVLDPVGNRLVVAQTTYAELKKANQELATLDELLTAIGPNTVAVAELKPDEAIGPVAAVIRKRLATDWKDGRILLASFSQSTLRDCKAVLPDLEMIVNERWSSVKAVWRARQLGTRRITLRSWWLWSGVIGNLNRRGYIVSTYTVNKVRRIHRWQRHGLHAVITDYPDRFR